MCHVSHLLGWKSLILLFFLKFCFPLEMAPHPLPSPITCSPLEKNVRQKTLDLGDPSCLMGNRCECFKDTEYTEFHKMT